MRRGTARRRGGSLVTTVGFLGVGVSSAVLLAAGTRLLGATGFPGLGLVWTVATVFGFGLGTPVEQVVTRRVNVGAAHAIRRPLALLGTSAAVFAVLSWVLGSRAAAAQTYTPLVPATVLAIAGWTVAVVVRGRIAGAGDLQAYGGLLAVESVTRVALVALAVADKAASPVLLGAAVGLPLVVAAGLGSLLRISPGPSRPAAELDVVRAEVFGFMAVSLSFQLCLNAPPLLIEWKTGVRAGPVVGAFVVANSYFRVPAVLMGGVSTHALVSLSHAWGDRDYERFRAVLTSSLRTIALLAVGATGLAAVAAPRVLPLYNGRPLDLPTTLLVSLAVSTVVAVVAGVGVQPLFAAGHGRWAAAAWMSGAVVTPVCLALSSGTDGLASFGLVAGPSVALVIAFWALVRLRLTDPRTFQARL